ncbi:hypothetical protein [Kineosporia sp. A_224]|uniref:hypothetical protein n=1 Tax=Kineosporia sp. A_224 TaxID=1962180 RepID=UPI000B4B1E9C|nr:hypothetical protein [Kineosporia sp. A_224]
MRAVTIGIHFGTLSGRAVVVDVADGCEPGNAVHESACGVIDDLLPTGRALPPLRVPQDTADWRQCWARAVPDALRTRGVDASDASEVVGVGVDATACTVLPGPRTAPEGLRDRLRCNAAYHRLGQGL